MAINIPSPNLDALASKGMLYLVLVTAPVRPARTTLISGLYPPSTGVEHMRSNTRLPSRFKYNDYLRGGITAPTIHEDYNLGKEGEVWNER